MERRAVITSSVPRGAPVATALVVCAVAAGLLGHPQLGGGSARAQDAPPAGAQGDPDEGSPTEPAAADPSPTELPLVEASESAPADTTPEGANAGCENKDDSNLVQQQVTADSRRELLDITRQTIEQALAIAAEHWEARDAAFIAALAARAAGFPTTAAPLDPSAQPPGAAVCQMLADPDLASCDIEADPSRLAACQALKIALSAPARVPSVCILAPKAMQPSCRLVFGGDAAPCRRATGEAASSCQSLLAVAGREVELCGAVLQPGRCLDALLIAGLGGGPERCAEVLVHDRDAPERWVIRDQCRAVLAGAPERCPADAHAVRLRSTGDALLRASFGVAWMTFAVGANGPAMCAVKATVYEGDSALTTQIATVFAPSAGQAFTTARRLSSALHASRSVLGVQHACVPSVAWEPRRDETGP